MYITVIEMIVICNVLCTSCNNIKYSYFKVG